MSTALRVLLVGVVGLGTNGCLLAYEAATDPHLHPYSGPTEKESHADVRLTRDYGKGPHEEVGNETTIGSVLYMDTDGIVRVAPGTVRWSFKSAIFDKKPSGLLPTTENTCNLTAAFELAAGRSYHLVYTHEHRNDCRIECTDVTGGQTAACKRG